MVTVKSREEMMRFIREGFKPYYHKTAKRWYLRRGSAEAYNRKRA